MFISKMPNRAAPRTKSSASIRTAAGVARSGTAGPLAGTASDAAMVAMLSSPLAGSPGDPAGGERKRPRAQAAAPFRDLSDRAQAPADAWDHYFAGAGAAVG